MRKFLSTISLAFLTHFIVSRAIKDNVMVFGPLGRLSAQGLQKVVASATTMLHKRLFVESQGLQHVRVCLMSSEK
jgi:hypothetical protein